MKTVTKIYTCQTCGELVPLGCCTCGPRQRPVELKRHNPWRELWIEWFDFDGEPWLYDSEQDATFCIFCGNNREYGHSRTCVYPRVKRLLDEEAT